MAVMLVQKSFSVANISYIVSGESKLSRAIGDCKAAVRWVMANAKKYHLECR